MERVLWVVVLTLALLAPLSAPGIAQDTGSLITRLDVSLNDDGTTYHVVVSASNSGGSEVRQDYTVMDSPPSGEPVIVFQGWVQLSPGFARDQPFDWTPTSAGDHQLFIAEQPDIGADVAIAPTSDGLVAAPPPGTTDNQPLVVVDTSASIQVGSQAATAVPTSRVANGEDCSVTVVGQGNLHSLTGARLALSNLVAGPLIAQTSPTPCPPPPAAVCRLALLAGIGIITSDDVWPGLDGLPVPKEYNVRKQGADTLASALVAVWGFNDKQVTEYTRVNAMANKAALKGLFDGLQQKVKQLDVRCTSAYVFIYVGGHGVTKFPSKDDALWIKAPDDTFHKGIFTLEGYDSSHIEKTKVLWDFELADQVKQLNVTLQANPKLTTQNVIVDIDACSAETFLSPLVAMKNLKNVSLGWAAGVGCKIKLSDKQIVTPWVQGFVRPFQDSYGSPDPKATVTVEQAHQSATANANTVTPGQGADYSPKPQNPAVNPKN
jgi:hypothetical protein